MTVTERFLHYISFNTQADPDSGKHPSSDSQLEFGKVLASELEALGVKEVFQDSFGYVYGVLPATPGCEEETPMGLIAHMDTAPDMSGEKIQPQIISNYNGADIVLNEVEQIYMKVSAYPALKDYIGQDLIVTDGTTLLGSDDKAGIAEIMTLLDKLKQTPDISHGTIYIAFTPDEEIGEGADHFDLKRFAADYAYTVDGGKLGELEYENFNAASAVVTIQGVNIHPGEAKGKMKNALRMANAFLNKLPAFETPEQTSGREGFFHVTDFHGDVGNAELRLIIRDHDRQIFAGRKAFLENLTKALNEEFGEDRFAITIKDSYFNMKDMILPHIWIVHKAQEAMRRCGVESQILPIRGGTDGAKLSYMGLPCPNLSTGGHYFHGPYECIPVQSMEKMVEVLTELVRGQI